MEKEFRIPRKLSVQAWINILGPALEEACRKLDCKKENHKHPNLRLLPPRWEDQGK